MKKWKYTLPNGLRLRQMVQESDSCESDCEKISKEIEAAYVFIADFLGCEADTSDISDDIECQCFDEESVNYHLANLYDYCDTLGVWIETCEVE